MRKRSYRPLDVQRSIARRPTMMLCARCLGLQRPTSQNGNDHRQDACGTGCPVCADLAVQSMRLPRRSLPPRSLLALQRERETRLGFNRIIGRIADAFVGHTELEAGAVRTACGQADLDPAVDILG